MVEAAPNTFKLDEYLKDVVQAVQAACTTALPHLQDSKQDTVDQAIDDSSEILNTVMAGHVEEWIE